MYFSPLAPRGAVARTLVRCLLLLIVGVPLGAFAQNVSVSGKVTDADSKAPLSGVTVWIPALRIGAVTTPQGEFMIRNVPPGRQTVQAKLVGYYTANQTVDVEAGKALTLSFALTVNPLKQEDIVITGLTGEVNKKTLGNEIAVVPGDVVNRVASPTAIDALAGSTPGIEVTRSSGVPGAGTYITLRGRKTIYGSSEPLYIVDGVVIDNSDNIDANNFQNGNFSMGNRVTDINPQDIASIEILKGASAAAIYGSEAANGVVIITTKHGQYVQGTTTKAAAISFTSSYEIDNNVGSVPLQTQFGQRVAYSPYHPGSSDSYGPAIPAGTPTYAQDKVPFHTGFSNEQSLSVSGGSSGFNYLASGTYSNIAGTALVGSSLNRKNLRLNLGTTILPHLELQNNANYVSSLADFPQDGSNRSGILLGALRTTPTFDNTQYLESDGATQRRYAGYDNPIWTQHFNTVQSGIDRFLNSTQLKYTPADWVTFEGRLGIDRYTQSNDIRLGVGSGSSPSRQGMVDHWVFGSNNLNADLTATMQDRLTEDLLGTLVVGNQTLVANGTVDETESEATLPFYDQISSGATKNGFSTRGEARKVGFFGQATGTYQDRYTLTLGGRYDGSSTFGTDNQFHFYPKISASYILSQEQFFKDLDWKFVSQLKLRGSFGQAGSPSLPGAYATNFLFTTAGFNDSWGRATSASRSGFIGIRQGGGPTSADYIVAGNTGIQPELNTEREGGIDLTLWDNRMTLSATAYHDDITHLILAVPVAGSTGYDQQLRNAGEMYNAGIELSLSVVPINMEDLQWTTTLNYARNYNIVTSLDIKPGEDPKASTGYIYLNGGFTGINNVAMVGHPLGEFLGTGWLRDASGKIVYSTGAADDDYGNDFRGAPRQQTNVLLGDPNPAYTLSWQNSLTIMKDWTLSFLFDAVQGFKVWNGTKGALYNFGTAGDTKDRTAPWFNQDGQPVIDNGTGQQATKLSYYREYANGFNINEPFIEDGSFIKLREVSLSYRMIPPSEWNINSFTFTLTGRNLLTITKYTGFDPEVNTFALAEGRGFDYFTAPQVRSFRFSIAVNY